MEMPIAFKVKELSQILDVSTPAVSQSMDWKKCLIPTPQPIKGCG